ncbi:sulfur oxidation c-type cytochrome SoxX [Marinobacter sp. M216]|uniref:Sulfur oxidation c-type cytochrome SoxX n=1 Tax=Marinobacter albus TaxID=3030833 RepID=A0ABT7HC74_9GAMM|nr:MULTISPECIES: sulfur oxidation c-type cytochrome SoxX [unclassified Marinobacter]MBW7469786.1 sulfur oxidation c-type cytochrome SoxX [Marinobacter sp. F4218]MDK9557955.1 sulfur oxidation c-type cytochrome SoxX [Marinobacter sp. M216]
MRKTIIAMSFTTLALGAAPHVVAEPSQADIDRGKELAFSRKDGNCLACHKMDDGKLTGTIGPELVDMKTRYPDREMLFKRIWDETKFNPVTVMPPFGKHMIMSKDEINRVIDYLYTL